VELVHAPELFAVRGKDMKRWLLLIFGAVAVLILAAFPESGAQIAKSKGTITTKAPPAPQKSTIKL